MLEFNKWFFVLLANFLILLYLLNMILFKPLLALFKERENATEGSLKAADELLQKKDEAALKLKKEITNARDKAKALYNSIKNEGLEQQKELTGKAQEEAWSMLDEARKKLKEEASKARESLKEEVDRYSEEITNKLVKV